MTGPGPHTPPPPPGPGRDLAAPLTADEARELTGEIRQRLDGLLPLIKRAFEGRADMALGYESWQAYCTAELNDVRVPLADRPAMVAELRAAGMSQRAIGSALGVGVGTVNRDLATVPGGTVDQPERITSLDGRERPASRPQTPAPLPEPGPEASTSAGPGHDHPHPAARPAAQPEANGRLPRPGAGPLADAMAEAIYMAQQRVAQQRADRDALCAPREVIDAVNAATHFVPAMVRIQSGCEDLLHSVNGIDPERAVTDLPEQWRDRLKVARDAHAYLSRVVDALDRIGVPA